MSINQVTQGLLRSSSLTNNEVKLRQGQITSGKVMKLYPEQKAEVRLTNGQRLIAQLEAPLTVGKSYDFQVEVSKQAVFLRIIQERSSNDSLSAEKLLNVFNEKNTRANRQFTTELMRQNTLFTKAQLSKSIKLLESFKGEAHVTDILIKLIKNNMPLQRQIVQAELALRTTQVDGLSRQIIEELKAILTKEAMQFEKSPTAEINHHQKLLSSLNKALSTRKNTNETELGKSQTEKLLLKLERYLDASKFEQGIIEKRVGNLIQSRESLFNILSDRNSQLKDVPFIEWNRTWLNFSANTKASLPYQLTDEALLNGLNQATELGKQLDSLVDRWNRQVGNRNLIQEPLTKIEHRELQNEVRGLPISTKDMTKLMDVLNRTTKQKPNDALMFRMLHTINDNIQDLMMAKDKILVGGQQDSLIQGLEKNETLLELIRDITEQMKINSNTARTSNADKPLEHLSEQLQAVIWKWDELLQSRNFQQTPLTLNERQALLNDLRQLSLPAREIAQIVHTINQLPTSAVGEERIFKTLHIINEELLVISDSKETLLQNANKKGALLELVRPFLEQLAPGQNREQLDGSLRGQITQFLEKSEFSQSDHLPKLLHLLNGLQLNSVATQGDFIHASLQLPGGAIGLKNDMQLEFSSKGQENGEIDADYCRVIFYLHLENLDETIIDMNVQKRIISLTIFNEQPELKKITSIFEEELREGLKVIGYQLQGIQVKESSSVGSLSGEVLDEPLESTNDLERYDFKI